MRPHLKKTKKPKGRNKTQEFTWCVEEPVREPEFDNRTVRFSMALLELPSLKPKALHFLL